jgi:parallel beta-helix repeat protein/predicted outer membrane repeat protein
MRYLIAILAAAVALLPLTADGTIWYVPDNFSTIQEGINGIPDGDTLVVREGTYHENLNFNGHNVVLASLFLTTGDTAYISSTIIDGSRSGSVITFESGEENTAMVVGFTVQRGSADYGGGVYCHRSSPTISNIAVKRNSADEYRGGGIYCNESNAVIQRCIISHNSAYEYGGGIYCQGIGYTPRISNNTISENGTYDVGGGIACVYSAPIISRNTISENWTENDGGGIYCENSNPTITDNTISSNEAGNGGGLSFFLSSPTTIENNRISRNSAFCGGGIYCLNYSSPTLTSNTISGDSADYGGGICCNYYSFPTIINTILWGDTARMRGSEIDTIFRSYPIVSYCDIQGGWSGAGNINADPVFAGPYNEDFHLRSHSPCIDAGHPDPQYNDPDGTRADMGAFYFNQDVDGIVELYPHDTPIVIPPEGGDLIYDGWVFNFFGHPGRIDIWTYAFVPEMGRYGPIDLYENVRIPADSLGRNEITEHVPGVAPQGDYVFVAYIGDYPSTIIDSSWFYFSKTGSVAEGIADWQSPNGWLDGEVLSRESGLPTHYALSHNYPNPFNATTSISYQLGVDGHVKLEVYSTLGRKVATLIDSKQQAGYRSVTWNASQVSSGLYFYKLTAGDFTETRRMILIK